MQTRRRIILTVASIMAACLGVISLFSYLHHRWHREVIVHQGPLGETARLVVSFKREPLSQAALGQALTFGDNEGELAFTIISCDGRGTLPSGSLWDHAEFPSGDVRLSQVNDDLYELHARWRWEIRQWPEQYPYWTVLRIPDDPDGN